MPRRNAVMPCPYKADHTSEPEGYVVWHYWAAEMSKTHEQVKCEGCGLYAIWRPRGEATDA